MLLSVSSFPRLTAYIHAAPNYCCSEKFAFRTTSVPFKLSMYIVDFFAWLLMGLMVVPMLHLAAVTRCQWATHAPHRRPVSKYWKNPRAFPIKHHFCGATTNYVPRSRNVPEYNGSFFSLVWPPDLVISCRVVKAISALFSLVERDRDLCRNLFQGWLKMATRSPKGGLADFTTNL